MEPSVAGMPSITDFVFAKAVDRGHAGELRNASREIREMVGCRSAADASRGPQVKIGGQLIFHPQQARFGGSCRP